MVSGTRQEGGAPYRKGVNPSVRRHSGRARRARRAWSGAVTLAPWLFLAAVACGRAPEIEPPPPDTVGDIAEAVQPLPASVVESEVRYELAPALVALERAVPRTFGDINTRLPVANNRRVHIAFAARRSPFSISVDSQRVTIASVVEYEGRGWYKPVIGPEVSAACGTGNVAKPRARVRLESTIHLQESWSLAARTRVTRVAPYSTETRDKCAVTLFRIDVTDRVMKATREVLEKQVRTLDRALAEVNTKARFERWWRDISRPIRLTDSVYLTINPRNVQLGRVTVDSGFAVAHVRLEALPRIDTGHRPNDFVLFTPLPPLRSGPLEGKGLRVSLEAMFGYDVATAMVRKALAGRTFERGGRSIRIRDVSLMGIGGGRVALGVRFDGDARGVVYLTGTPRYDNAADQLVIPDLDYDLYTASLLVKGLAFLGDERLRDLLRQNTRFPLQGQLDRLRALAVKGMNRNLAEGVLLIASLDEVQNVGVRATRTALVARADAGGTLQLQIARPVSAARPRPSRRAAPRVR